MVAMILAGGQGSRLGALTAHVAKPAVSFGGKYKIIDFVLSNCTNSGLDTVGVLTQYKPLDLNAHIGNGAPWDLDVRRGGISLLPPYMRKTSAQWYHGTANAVYQNLEYLEQYQPEYVLILSGDHIYKMDYSDMLIHHKKKGAELTVAVIDVPKEEAKRFGILNINGDRRILDFEEKPRQPKSTLASMGVYIFNYDVLKRVLKEDEQKEKSAHDFGKNIIPSMLESGISLYAYPFAGYWKDIGTPESIWQANMDLLSPENPLELYGNDWQIYTRPNDLPPHYISYDAKVEQSIISQGCTIHGTVKRSVLFPGVTVEKDAIVEDSVVMSDCVISSFSHVKKAIVCEQIKIQPGICVGNGTEVEIISGEPKILQQSVAAG